jgi:hypothetical protein
VNTKHSPMNVICSISPESWGRDRVVRVTHHIGSQIRGEEQDKPIPEWSEDVPADHGLVHARVLVGVQPLILGSSDSHFDFALSRAGSAGAVIARLGGRLSSPTFESFGQCGVVRERMRRLSMLQQLVIEVERVWGEQVIDDE